MKGILCLIALTTLCLLNVLAFGQLPVRSARLSRPASWSPTVLKLSAVTGTTVCDATRNVYLRLAREHQQALEAPIRIIRPTGESIEVDLAKELSDHVFALAFGVDPDGNLYATLQVGKGIRWYVASFDPPANSSARFRSRRIFFLILFFR